MLTSSTLVQAGPLMLETAIKHYLDRKAVTKDSEAREEFLFDEAFVLVKRFLEISSRHTVEDLQAFSQAKTPSPPWVLTHHVLVPMVTCTDAAGYLVNALGGEQKALEMCGGTKWWTVRMQRGVECEWIGIKKDIMEEEERVAKRRTLVSKKSMIRVGIDRRGSEKRLNENVSPAEKANAGGEAEAQKDDGANDDEFSPEMDTQRCLLYVHGGAYYWGSINTHRYSIWRHARKSRGRAFACNYRKAPQYPFPCALLDVLASYIFLIKPPPGAEHRPVDPKRLTVAGDSAGGGLVLALLQVLRDVGLPLPAGAVLISPWCDLTHSFPSVMDNTASDIIPPYGFIHKPSTLWPPPPPHLSEDIQSRIRDRVKEAVHRLKHGQNIGDRDSDEARLDKADSPQSRKGTDSGKGDSAEDGNTTVRGDTQVRKEDGTTLFPVSERGTSYQPSSGKEPSRSSAADPASHSDVMSIQIDGKETTIRSQIQLYATNSQLAHPYVSPALGYLGGLCPLLVIASDKEVLRDEIVYMAHKASDPQSYPVREGVKDMLPSLRTLDASQPTQVHLQIYDDTCHVLPLFSMCEPAKHCYRAIASFSRHVTSRNTGEASTSAIERYPASLRPSTSEPSAVSITGTDSLSQSGGAAHLDAGIPKPVSRLLVAEGSGTSSKTGGNLALDIDALRFTESPEPSIRHFRADGPSRSPSTLLATSPAEAAPGDADYTTQLPSIVPRIPSGSEDPLDQRFPADEVRVPRTITEGHAGHFGVYVGWNGHTMIRERVSRKGVCRPLEDPAELSCLHQPLEQIGVLREGPVKRYLQGQSLWDERFKSTAKRIEKRRLEHIKKAQSDAGKAIQTWKGKVDEEKAARERSGQPFEEMNFMVENEFSWTWALRGENPPPTAIIARRDTPEWRNLALQADRMTDSSSTMNGLTLWTAVAGCFSKDSTSSRAPPPRKTPVKDNRGMGGAKFSALFKGDKKKSSKETVIESS